MKYISKKQDGSNIIFTFSVVNRSRNKKFYYTVKNIIEFIKKDNGGDLKDYVFLENQSSGVIDNSNPEGRYVFKKKSVDISKDYVKIEPIKNKAETPENKSKVLEQEASLPYGLKKTTKTTTKTRRKRATKKKTTEE
tara:strand:+ start:2262 stop:2672 length:411 start_codon:yes stop_codon:yes gene_type:complete